MSAAIDITAIGSWLAVAVSATTFVGMVRASFTAGAKKNAYDIAELETKQTDLEGRMVEIESAFKSFPTQEKLTSFEVSIAQLSVQINTIRRERSEGNVLMHELLMELRGSTVSHHSRRK